MAVITKGCPNRKESMNDIDLSDIDALLKSQMCGAAISQSGLVLKPPQHTINEFSKISNFQLASSAIDVDMLVAKAKRAMADNILECLRNYIVFDTCTDFDGIRIRATFDPKSLP